MPQEPTPRGVSVERFFTALAICHHHPTYFAAVAPVYPNFRSCSLCVGI
jgi:hypothetical protein